MIPRHFLTRVQAFTSLGRGTELGVQAIDAIGDSHLAKGINIRLATAPHLALPLQPLVVTRLSAGPGRTWPAVRADIVWVNNRGVRLVPPIIVSPSQTVRGYLPKTNSTSCCWLQVHGQSISGLSVDAVMETEMGPTIVASRSKAPFELTSTPIDWIEVRGLGRIDGVSWLDPGDILAEMRRRSRLPDQDPSQVLPWRVLSMPVTDAERYSHATPDAQQEAEDRVAEGAPKRFGLHDEPSAANPAASPLAQPDHEQARLADIIPTLRDYLQKLVETSTPEDLTDTMNPPPRDGVSLSIPLLDAVLQSLSDPGVARWMGHAVVDQDPPSTTPGDLVAYGIFGTWWLEDLIEGRSAELSRATVCAAVIGHPGDRPVTPVFEEPVGGAFMADTPPAVRRRVDLRIKGLSPGAGLAVARRLGAQVTGLNKRMPSGRAIPFVPNIPDNIPASENLGLVASITDRTAPPDAVVYRAGQNDWFGRWSEWAERNAAEAPRPPPPAPVLQAVYTPPTVGTPVQVGAISGTIRVSVPVPPRNGLSPGGRLLDRLELSVDGAVRNIGIPDPMNPPGELTADIPSPPIERAGLRTVTVDAHWIDQASVRSAPANPRTLTLRDPRPADSVMLPPGLRYTARPDATGSARFRLQWLSGAGQAFFRVFYASETQVIRGLTDLASAGGPPGARAGRALEGLAGLRDPEERADIMNGVADVLDRALFEQVTSSPLKNGGTGALMTFDHAVSGALQELSFYRVISVTVAQVESGFSEASLVPVKVPNTGVPPRPTLAVSPTIDSQTGRFAAALTVSVPLGNIVAAEFRIRRAIEGTGDIESMSVIARGPLSETPEGRRRAKHRDQGSAPFGGTLKPWTRYVWRVEVRGSNEAGGGPEAEWSAPSVSVSHIFVPPDPPAPPEIVRMDIMQVGVAKGVVLRFRHPDPLQGSQARGYMFEVYREPPNAPATRLSALSAGASVGEGGRDATGEFHVIDTLPAPPGTAYRVLVKDPLGRASRASDPVFVMEA